MIVALAFADDASNNNRVIVTTDDKLVVVEWFFPTFLINDGQGGMRMEQSFFNPQAQDGGDHYSIDYIKGGKNTVKAKMVAKKLKITKCNLKKDRIVARIDRSKQKGDVDIKITFTLNNSFALIWYSSKYAYSDGGKEFYFYFTVKEDGTVVPKGNWVPKDGDKQGYFKS